MRNNLKQIRKIKKVTQTELADHLTVSKAMISMWENNPNERIPQDRVKQIAKYLRVEEKHIFTDELDVESLKRETELEEFQQLAERYAEIYEAEQLQRIEELDFHYKVINEELDRMINEPEKLEQVKRFCQLVNRDGDSVEVDFLFRLIDYLLNQTEEREDEKMMFVNDELITALEMFYQKIKSKGNWR
jgi:transcriptional regulator with XRE-family HTH domain